MYTIPKVKLFLLMLPWTVAPSSTTFPRFIVKLLAWMLPWNGAPPNHPFIPAWKCIIFLGKIFYYYNARTKLLSLSCLKIATESGNRFFDIGRYIFQGSRVFDGRYGRFNLVVVNFWAYAGRIIMFQVCLMTIFGLHLHIQNTILLIIDLHGHLARYQWYWSLVNNWLICKEIAQCVTLDYFSVVSHV